MVREKFMKKKYFLPILAIIFLSLIFLYKSYLAKHSFVIKANDGKNIGTVEISPVFSKIKVGSKKDTNVVFVESKSGEEIEIPYLTNGVYEKIKLKNGHWYKIKASEDIEIIGVNVRIE